jgi:hypothetical protein
MIKYRLKTLGFGSWVEQWHLPIIKIIECFWLETVLIPSLLQVALASTLVFKTFTI